MVLTKGKIKTTSTLFRHVFARHFAKNYKVLRGSKRPRLSIVKFNTTNLVYSLRCDEKS